LPQLWPADKPEIAPPQRSPLPAPLVKNSFEEEYGPSFLSDAKKTDFFGP
jgi:hypothetical protein